MEFNYLNVEKAEKKLSGFDTMDVWLFEAAFELKTQTFIH